MEASRAIAAFIADFCRRVNVNDAPAVEAVGRTLGKRMADYRVFVGKSNLELHLKCLVRELLSASVAWTVPVAKCELVLSSRYVHVWLNRTSAYRSLLDFIFKMPSTEGRQQDYTGGESVLVFVPHLDASFTSVRTEQLAAFVARCYSERCTDVVIYSSKPFYTQQSSASVLTCSADCCLLGARESDVASVALGSKFYDEKDMTFDLRSYVISEDLDVMGYEYACLGKVSIQSQAFVIASQLAHALQRHCEAPPAVVIVVAPACKSFVVQQAGLLFQLELAEKKPRLLHLIHEGSVEPADQSFNDYWHRRKAFVSEAFHRPQAFCSPEDLTFADDCPGSGNRLQAAVNVLVETEVAYEFLSSKQNVKMKLAERLRHAENGHYFCQYTLARIAAILDKYESAVKEGVYPALCSLPDVDWARLSEESEWLLWHRLCQCWQVLGEPMPVRLPASVKVEVNAHSLLRALEGLCSEFSGYYGKVRVLLHPEPHLNATVCARMWLIKAVQKTVLRMLKRFGLCALNRM
uniref:Putative arginyl-trna synthetase translation n=1 Tax=Amblyomma aureolatum TaxID=187763 RepID=A0A1E1X6F2_9ACAR